jgi:putative transposase
LSTKLHAAVDRRGRLLRMVLTPGQRGDCPQANELLSGLVCGTVGHVIADAAYDGDELRQRVRRLRAKACIKPNPTRKRKKRHDPGRYKHRNVIERFFCRIRRCRRVATRYEKKAANFAGFVYLAAFVTTEE